MLPKHLQDALNKYEEKNGKTFFIQTSIVECDPFACETKEQVTIYNNPEYAEKYNEKNEIMLAINKENNLEKKQALEKKLNFIEIELACIEKNGTLNA